MADQEWGPVEIMLVGFEGEKPTQGVVDAVTELVTSGTVRLLDLLFVSRSEEGAVSSAEWEDAGEGYGFADLELEAPGLAGEEDVEDFAPLLPEGATAILLVVELVWAKSFGAQLLSSEGGIIASQRIPETIVNAAAAIALADIDQVTSNMTRMRRTGRPGLIGLAARTAAVAGTVGIVSGGAARRHQATAALDVQREQLVAQEEQAQIAAAVAAAVSSGQEVAPPQASATDLISGLERLAKLCRDGVLTEAEFSTAKARLLR